MAKHKVDDDDLDLEDELDLDDDLGDVNLDSDSGLGKNPDVVDKKILSNTLLAIINQWREENVDSLLNNAKEIGYNKLNKDEMLLLTDFVVASSAPGIVKAMETATANWLRLTFHLVEIADLENSAMIDLKKKAAQSLPDPDEKNSKKYTEKDRESVVELETEDLKRYHAKVKKVKMQFNTLVACTKEYINILKKLLEYYMGKSGAMHND